MIEALDRYQRKGQGIADDLPVHSPAAAPATDFFTSIFNTPTQTMGIRKIPLNQIDPWKDTDGSPQPFRLYRSEKLHELADNIRQNGLIVPVRLRINPADTMRYQTLAGHNRIAAAKLIGLTEIEAIVEDVDDDTARLIVVDSNLCQREKLLPSEKAFAYKIRLDSLKRKAGRRAIKNSCQVGTNFRADEILAETSTESARQIQRYVSLTRLLPALLDMVDAETIPLVAGVALSFLSQAAQHTLLDVMHVEDIKKITLAQAEELKHLKTELDMDGAASLIYRVLGLSAAAPARRPVLRIPAAELTAEELKQYSHDAELQRRVTETIRRYIAEKKNGRI